ncbi:MAG: hypothetical protein UV35_C0011G0017 [candidate division WWE3 bacterium GW2011_GWB1_42_6]|uniref:Uncharacterized protein n=1 Tax=candidate division WWE3 bacterium GW2011_GWB1_42_6 TaxID=1619115 RepID=A0A0G1B079_UNCKA|nr:MAG: hypothetical protein UV35_C0011G0017 [candidate division WWE3 bacterium GW2011_GWB1_42_6]
MGSQKLKRKQEAELDCLKRKEEEKKQRGEQLNKQEQKRLKDLERLRRTG